MSDAVSHASWHPAMRPNALADIIGDKSEAREGQASPASGSAETQHDFDELEATVTPASKTIDAQRSPSRHFAQSASIHQVPESDDAEASQEGQDPFEDLPRQGIDYTNSFPVVNQASLAKSVPEPLPLPHSQAEEIVKEEETAREPALEVPVSASENIDWGEDTEADFLADVKGGHDATVVAEIEARFEEGIPLVQDASEPTKDASAALDWGEGPVEDDFFGGSQPEEEPASKLIRKSTDQVIDPTQFPPHSINHGMESPATDSGIAFSVSQTTSEEPFSKESMPTGVALAEQQPDLSAAWSAAFDDDELLAEDSSMDPSAFFEDDGEGFLDEAAEQPSPAANATQSTPVQIKQTQAYTPQHTLNYAPNAAVQRQAVTTAPPPPAMIGQPQLPNPSQTKSFVDKKGGYESPYDLPMDIRPRGQPAARSIRLSQPSPQMPPPRASSVAGQPSPTMPFSNGSNPSAARPTTTQPTSFFEELPVVAKPPRPASAARFPPQSPQIQPPRLQQGPPQGLPQGLPQVTAPARPEAPSNPPNPDFSHGLVMPQRNLPFGTDGGQQPDARPVAAPQPPKASTRYSPVQPAAQSQTTSPARNRYTAASPVTPPSAPPSGLNRAPSGSFAAAFQPRTSSPLAKSTSNHDESAATRLNQERGVLTTPPKLPSPVRHVDHNTPEKQIPAYSSSTVVRHRRAPSIIKQYAPPTDARGEDSLERWRGAPIFNFGAGGIVSSFPVETPRFSVSSTQPLYTVSPGEVKMRNAKQLPAVDEAFGTFPGPLKSKGKKKELLAWLNKRTEGLKQEVLHPETNLNSELARQRREDRVTLLQVITALVEYDGNLDANPAAVAAVRDILCPGPAVDAKAGAANYGSEVPPGISRSNNNNLPSRATDVEAIEQIRQHLLQGNREKAVWHAVDKNQWSHAMLIASTIQGETWKQVVHEFVKSEVRTCGNNTEALSALYDVFSGNWDESVDQLVPAAARSGFQMISTAGTPSAGNASTGLDKWQETLALIVGNRTAGDVKAIISLGELLAGYGRAEAAHVCYIVAKLPGLLSGADDPTAHAVLLGANHRQQLYDIHRDTDALAATEAYEFATNILAGAAQPMQYLIPFKLHHALLLADAGQREASQAYCEVVSAAFKSNKVSPYVHSQLHGILEDLVDRLSQTPKGASSGWLKNPKMGDVSNSLFNRFNKFVSGDETETSSANLSISGEQGPFGAINGEPVSISRAGSPAVHAGHYGNAQVGGSMQAPGASSRYAPGAPASYSSSPASSYTPQHRDSSGSLPRMSPDHFRRVPPSTYQSAGAYTPTSGLAAAPKSYGELPLSPPAALSNPELLSAVSESRPSTSDGPQPPPQGRRTSYEPLSVPKQAIRDRNSSAYQPRSGGFESRSSSYAPRSGSYAPRSYAPSPAASERLADDQSRQSSGSYVPQAPLQEEPEVLPQAQPVISDASISSATGNENELPEQQRPDDVQPGSEAPISFGGYDPTPTSFSQPAATASVANTTENIPPAESANPSYGQSYDPPINTGEEPVTGYEAPTQGGYEPPTAGGYEPPTSGYQPYQHDDMARAESPPRTKKKGIMDLSDDEDDNVTKAAALKKAEKERKDHEANEAFKRAAEADAQRDKTKSAEKGSGWFGGWLGGKKKESSGSPEPTVHRAKLGEESSFVYDKNLQKWVNKKGGAEAATQPKATPPPPRGEPPPMRSVSTGPPAGGPPRSVSSGPLGAGLGATPPSRNQSPLVHMTTAGDAATNSNNNGSSGGPTSVPPSAPPSRPPGSALAAPPTRPSTAASNASSIDDLLGGGPPLGGRKGAAKKGKKGGRYVDVMAK